jgi:hypothetical protein
MNIALSSALFLAEITVMSKVLPISTKRNTLPDVGGVHACRGEDAGLARWFSFPEWRQNHIASLPIDVALGQQSLGLEPG